LLEEPVLSPRHPSGLVVAWSGAMLGFVVSAAVSTSGCVATVEERAPRVVYVAGPPPPPLEDAEGAPAVPGMIWVGGYWHWSGVQYVWIPGHWESPPAGYVWLAPRYTSFDGRYVYRAGQWRPRARVER